ncbi:MAG: hypothetical protein RR954_08475, partial [Christensenellaceae bacterium]
MKNYLKMTLTVAMAIPMLFSLPSCNKDEHQDEPPKEETTYKGRFKLAYTASADLLAVADIKISYNDETGTLVTEPVTTTDEWKKEVIYKKLPITVGFSIAYTAKNPLSTDKPKVDLEYSYEGSFSSLDAKTDDIIVVINPKKHSKTMIETKYIEIA